MINKKNNGRISGNTVLSRIGGFYAVIALLIIIATVGKFIYEIKTESEKGENSAKTTFAYFAKYLISLSEKEEFAESAYKERAEKFAAELRLEGFILSDSEKNICFSWPKDGEIIRQDESGSASIKTSSVFIKSFTAKINIKTKQNESKQFILSAAVPTVSGETIYIFARNSFFVVFTVLLVTLIIILLQKLSQSDNKIYADVPLEKNENNDLLTDTDTEDYSYLNASDETDVSDTANYSHPENHPVLKKEDGGKIYTLEDLDNLSITKKFPYEMCTELEEIQEPEEITVMQDNERNNFLNSDTGESANNHNTDYLENENTTDLYSPITGASLQTRLCECLQSELQQAGASEQELAFSIIKLKDFTIKSLVAKKIAEMLIKLIKSRDMIFEFDDDGFALIFQDTDLEQAMKKAEEIYAGIKTILNEYNISEPIMIGITTRSSRLIDADRMIEEAYAAITRAIKNTDDPIVAFRVNTEKYRQFISKN